MRGQKKVQKMWSFGHPLDKAASGVGQHCIGRMKIAICYSDVTLMF